MDISATSMLLRGHCHPADFPHFKDFKALLTSAIVIFPVRMGGDALQSDPVGSLGADWSGLRGRTPSISSVACPCQHRPIIILTVWEERCTNNKPICLTEVAEILAILILIMASSP